MKSKNNSEQNDLIRLIAITIVSIFVIATGAFYALSAYLKGDIAGSIGGILIALIILLFAIFTFIRGNNDLKKGFPLQDERSKRVMEKASSKAFYLSLYLLLAVGLLSETAIPFRDVSQATGVSVGIMALIWAALWAYYNSREI
jgi:uncharacterized membrane protein